MLHLFVIPCLVLASWQPFDVNMSLSRCAAGTGIELVRGGISQREQRSLGSEPRHPTGAFGGWMTCELI